MTREERIDAAVRPFAREELEGLHRHALMDERAKPSTSRITVDGCPQCQDLLARIRGAYKLLEAFA